MLDHFEKRALLNLGEDMYKQFTILDAVETQGAGTAVEVLNYDKFMAQVAGIVTATVKIEGSIDGTNFVDISGGGKSADGLTSLIQGLFYKIRANVSAYTSGTITVKLIAKK
jgi:hypothetical protein